MITASDRSRHTPTNAVSRADAPRATKNRRRLTLLSGTSTLKRGDYWMATGKVNPNPIVYSYGEIFFMSGWILFSLAMSITV